ncbi:Sec-independent protein translocase subunit TatA [Georgenia subflava]|uniref:Sec-independent protein translocase protein TatA n=1 Tax=Georgenia subflava TaxID=1622177 RepID=A0A6N7EKK7_9MICO|nr:Sec-independent protein translocase subunit TatA [Georgenia subflava]MPV38902.1 twin-arginine translocase TatA/TatE family subunit [Georgenia subflava]
MFRNGLQPSHIIILVLVIILIFGASKLPDIASNIGKSMKVFKKEVKELRDDDADTSSYTATGGQPPQQTTYPPYPGAQQPPTPGSQNPPGQQPGHGQYEPPVPPPAPGQGQSPDQPGQPRDGSGQPPQS